MFCVCFLHVYKPSAVVFAVVHHCEDCIPFDLMRFTPHLKDFSVFFCLFQTLESTQCLIVMHNTLQTFISICWIIKKCYLFTCVCNILGSSVFVCIGVIYLFCCTGVYVFSYIFYFPFAILLKLYKLYLALVKTFQFGHHFFSLMSPIVGCYHLLSMVFVVTSPIWTLLFLTVDGTVSKGFIKIIVHNKFKKLFDRDSFYKKLKAYFTAIIHFWQNRDFWCRW